MTNGQPNTLHSPQIRAMSDSDLQAVLSLQQRCYASAFHEPLAAFASKLQAAPGSCWVLPSTLPGELMAYLVCLPVAPGALPALHASDCPPPDEAAWLYVHDMAVAPEARGAGVAPQLLAQAHAWARLAGLKALALVAVQDSQPFWSKQGFQSVPDALPADKLASYGDGACFMLQALDDVRTAQQT